MTHGAGSDALAAQAARIPAFDGGSSTWAAAWWEHAYRNTCKVRSVRCRFVVSKLKPPAGCSALVKLGEPIKHTTPTDEVAVYWWSRTSNQDRNLAAQIVFTTTEN